LTKRQIVWLRGGRALRARNARALNRGPAGPRALPRGVSICTRNTITPMQTASTAPPFVDYDNLRHQLGSTGLSRQNPRG
jgi:hypothetical protein